MRNTLEDIENKLYSKYLCNKQIYTVFRLAFRLTVCNSTELYTYIEVT